MDHISDLPVPCPRCGGEGYQWSTGWYEPDQYRWRCECKVLRPHREEWSLMHPEIRLELIAALATDRAWDAVVMVGQALLDEYYPATVFDGSSGDPGPEYVVALRKALDHVRAIERQRK